MTDVLHVAVVDRNATVTLNRPESRNALSVELLRELPAAIQHCDERDDVDVIIITGGFEIALACDFLIASERARFADTHARVGVMPGWGLTVLLPQAIGVRRAREMSITGNFVDAQTALLWGLVNHVVPHDELLPFCRTLAADVVSNDQRGVRRMLQTYAAGALVSAGEAWKVEAAASKEWMASGGGDAEEIERRRQAIVDRGRSQVS